MGGINPNTTLLQSSKGSASDKTPAELALRSSGVLFAVQNIPPPAELYIDEDDALVVQAATSQTAEVVTVNLRLLLPNGRLEDNQFQIRPLNTRAVLKQVFPLTQGFLLSASASASVATTRGQTFCRIFLQRSASGTGQPGQGLFADYITASIAPAYPQGRFLAPTEGPGLVYNIAVSAPAAGADWAQTLPANARWRIRSWAARFVTSAAAANRQTSAFLFASGSNLWQAGASLNMIAATTYKVSAGGIVPYTPVDVTFIELPLPPDVILSGGSGFTQQLGVTTTNIQAADQWSLVNILVEEWLDNV